MDRGISFPVALPVGTVLLPAARLTAGSGPAQAVLKYTAPAPEGACLRCGRAPEPETSGCASPHRITVGGMDRSRPRRAVFASSVARHADKAEAGGELSRRGPSVPLRASEQATPGAWTRESCQAPGPGRCRVRPPKASTCRLGRPLLPAKQGCRVFPGHAYPIAARKRCLQAATPCGSQAGRTLSGPFTVVTSRTS